MTSPAKMHGLALELSTLPRIIFVLGKGGVGRSTVAAALACAIAARGERVLVLQWAVADSIGPWFGKSPGGQDPIQVRPNVSVANFSLEASLRAYFVDHLRLGLLYRRVIHAGPVWRLIQVSPGISEIFFLGELWWLINLAEKEAGLRFDRIVVDAPATGHGASLLDLPGTLKAMGASGLMGREVDRVDELIKNPALTGAVVVSLPEPLVMAETVELVPRVTQRLGRPPLALLINRSATAIAAASPPPGWLQTLALTPGARQTVQTVADELSVRARLEAELDESLARQTARGCFSLPELLGLSPVEVIDALTTGLGAAR